MDKNADGHITEAEVKEVLNNSLWLCLMFSLAFFFFALAVWGYFDRVIWSLLIIELSISMPLYVCTCFFVVLQVYAPGFTHDYRIGSLGKHCRLI